MEHKNRSSKLISCIIGVAQSGLLIDFSLIVSG